MINEEGTKFCTWCKLYKPRSEFCNKTSAKDYKCSHCKTCVNDLRFRNRYGIDKEEYEKIYIEQKGLCACCGKPPIGKGRDSILHLDHDHKTREVRGLLCHKCNLGLGSFDDSVELLEKAKNYLLTYRKNKLRVMTWK